MLYLGEIVRARIVPKLGIKVKETILNVILINKMTLPVLSSLLQEIKNEHLIFAWQTHKEWTFNDFDNNRNWQYRSEIKNLVISLKTQ